MVKNIIFSIISGLLLAVSWPTFGFPFILFIAFVPLLIVENNINNSFIKLRTTKIFVLSYLAFFIWNLIDTWWIYYSTLEGVILAILLNSLFMSSTFTFYSIIKRKKGIRLGLIFFISIWISFEKLHHSWDLNWPWLTLGNAFSEYYKFIQWYEFTGIFGGSLWILIVNSILYLIIIKYKIYSKEKIKRNILIILLLIFIPSITSLIFYYNYVIHKSDTINSIVVQPNVNPYTEKFNMTNSESFKNATRVISEIIDSNTQFVFFPETTLSEGEDLDNFIKSNVYKEIKEYISLYPKLNIIIGCTFNSIYKTKKTNTAIKSKKGNFYYDLYNSAILINNVNSPIIYHKSKLVPGVEIMPFASFFNYFFGNLIINLGGISGSHRTQEERTVFTNSVNNVKIAPIICYESVYGEFITKYVRNGANHLGIITNDAWWNNTQGHKQHFSYARLRAIECRKSISRSANTGISSFFNEKGDILDSISYGKKGALKMTIPINNKKTIYVLFGDYIAYISILVSLIIFLSSLIRKKLL